MLVAVAELLTQALGLPMRGLGPKKPVDRLEAVDERVIKWTNTRHFISRQIDWTQGDDWV